MNGKLYGLFFKGSDKSTVWYNVKSFKNAGVKATNIKTWPQFLAAAKTLRASGQKAYSLGGADGWTLTDLFENIYLRTAGAAKYNLAGEAQDQVDGSVGEDGARCRWRRVVGDANNIAGGKAGALQTDFNTSVSNVFSNSPKAAMVLEGDFVPGVVAAPGLQRDLGLQRVRLPVDQRLEADLGRRRRHRHDAEGHSGGQALINLPRNACMPRRSGRSAAASRPRTRMSSRASYPDPLQRKSAAGLVKAAVFDMSDLQPASFGATAGQGEWKLFQDFVSSPKQRQRHPEEARDGRCEGVQGSVVSSGSITAEPRSSGLRPPRSPARSGPLARLHGRGRASSRPRSSSSASGSSTRRSRRISQLLRPQTDRTSSGSTTTRRSSRRPRSRRRSRTTRSGSASSPRS